MSKPITSIVVLNHNTKELLARCLTSIYASTMSRNSYEVIVVDNNSSDGSQETVRKNFVQVKLIESKINTGFSAGNNHGIAHTSGEYILFLNSDVELKPEAIDELLTCMNGNPKIGAVSPKVMLFRGGMDPDCHRGFPTPWASLCYFLGLEALFPKSRIFGQYHQFYLNLNAPHEIAAGFGTVFFVRRKVLLQVGGWDEHYFFYGEDLDLCYRITSAGWKIMFYPEVLALHHKGASSGLRHESRSVQKVARGTRIRVAKESVRAMEIFYRKFYAKKYPSWLTATVLLGIRAKGFFRLVLHSMRGT